MAGTDCQNNLFAIKTGWRELNRNVMDEYGLALIVSLPGGVSRRFADPV
jgi:hypothetical protein